MAIEKQDIHGKTIFSFDLISLQIAQRKARESECQCCKVFIYIYIISLELSEEVGRFHSPSKFCHINLHMTGLIRVSGNQGEKAGTLLTVSILL